MSTKHKPPSPKSPVIRFGQRPMLRKVAGPPRIMQTKLPVQDQATVKSARSPLAPAVYRPTTPKVLQPKKTGSQQSPAPPVYRPQPTPRVLQTKKSQTTGDAARCDHTKCTHPPTLKNNVGMPSVAGQRSAVRNPVPQRSVVKRHIQRWPGSASQGSSVQAAFKHPQSGNVVQLLRIVDARAGKVAKVAERLEVPIEVKRDNGTSMTIRLNTSYKKHMVEAYISGGTEITAAPAVQNTISRLSESDFQKAFEDFAFLFAKRLSGVDPFVFAPNDANNELVTNRGLSFHSDSPNLGGEVHCFPTATGGNAVVLTQAEFADLRLVTNTAYHTTADLNNGTIGQVNNALVRYNASANIQALFTEPQRTAVNRAIARKVAASIANNEATAANRGDAGRLQGRINRGEVVPAATYGH